MRNKRNEFWQTCRFELGEKHGDLAHLVIQNDASPVIRRIDILLDRKRWLPDAIRISDAKGTMITTYVFEKWASHCFLIPRLFDEPEIVKKLLAEQELKELTSILQNAAEFEASQIRDALLCVLWLVL